MGNFTTINNVGKRTREWLKFRKQYLKGKQNFEGYYVCVNGHWTTTPEVDHIKKRGGHAELRLDPDNLRIFCPPCHRKRHN